MLSPMRAAVRLARACPSPIVPSSSCFIVVRRFSALSASTACGINTRTHGNQSLACPVSKYQQVRFSSTSSEPKSAKKISSLKSILRRFYLLTHPDKFTDYPAERAVNEHSVRDFIAYIEDYKRNPRGTSSKKPRHIPLTFYVRDETSPDAPLRKVTAELVANSSNPNAAKRRLVNLFNACGLDGDFTFEHDVWMPPDTENLHEFLSSSLNHARETLRQATLFTNIVNATISELERKYGVRVQMSTGADSYFSPAENKEVAVKLVKLMESLDIGETSWLSKGNLKGVEVWMDTEYDQSGEDADGNIYLSRKETVEDWEYFLKRVDWAAVHAHRQKIEKAANDEARAKIASQNAREKKEEDLIKLLGVRTVTVQLFNNFECKLSGEGKHLEDKKNDDVEIEVEDFEKDAHGILDRLLAAKSVLTNKNSKVAKKMKNIELIFCPNMPADMKYHISRTGKLRVSTKIQPKELMDLLTEKVTVIQELMRESDKYESLRDFIEVRLGLKFLTADYSYYYSQPESIIQVRKAYDKLKALSEKLRTHQLSGMTLAISDHYGLNLDGSLFIKWDFSDEDAVLLLEGAKQAQAEQSIPLEQQVQQQQQAAQQL